MVWYSIRRISLSPPRFKYANTRMRLRAFSLQRSDVLLEGEMWISPKPQKLCWLLYWQRCVTKPYRMGLLNVGMRCSGMHHSAFKGSKSEIISCRPFLYGIYCLLQMSLYGVQGATTKTDCQVINKECSEDVTGNMRWQLVDLKPKTCNSQYTTHLLLGRIRLRVWCRFWFEFGDP